VSVAAELPPIDHAARRELLRDSLDGLGCDILLVTHPNDVRHLSGFSGSNGTLLIGDVAHQDLLISDARYRERVGELDIPRSELSRRIPQVVAGLPKGARIGYDAEHVTVAAAGRLAEACPDGATLVPLDVPVAAVRIAKDVPALARIEAACAITAEALAWLATSVVRIGVSERELARVLEARFLQLGADGIAFPTIVASGVHGASPHHETGLRLLGAGELVTIDCGAAVDGYCADMTRTVATSPDGTLDGQLAEIHAVVEAANAAGRAAASPGASVAGVDDAARRVVTDAGYGEAFVHPTGHGIGLDVHEAPLVVGGSTASLTVGTAFTVEPGIYLAGIGGVRIEDSLAVRDDGCVVLTDMERRLVGA
jgi:Xaa-Pro aminopeptidase